MKLNLNKNIFWPCLLIAHVLLMFFLYRQFGLSTINEGDKYLSRAELFASGDFVNATQYQTFYIAYVSYLSAFVFLKSPVTLIFLSTYLLSLFAYFKFFKLIEAQINLPTAKIWLTLILLSPMLQYWQLNLFSETFFVAVSLLFCYVSLIPNLKYRFLKMFLLGIVAIFSRPSGIFTVITITIFTLYQNKILSKKQALFSGITLLLILFIGILFFFQLPYRDFSQYISNGSVYYGFPSWNQPQLPPGNYTLFDCYLFIIEHKGLGTLAGLFIQKLDSFFLTTRVYYSNFHNIINKVHHVFYFIALAALVISFKKNKPIFKLLLAFLVIFTLNSLMITLIFNEWSERHTVHVFPYVFLLSAYCINLILSRFVKKQQN